MGTNQTLSTSTSEQKNVNTDRDPDSPSLLFISLPILPDMSTLSAATAGPAHRVQSAVEEYGYPQGHLGHLNTDQEAAFKNFKLVLEEKGLYKPGTGEEEPGTHDDATLLYEIS